MKMAYLKNVVSLRLDHDACVGCGRCLEVCPHGVFVMKDGKCHIADRDTCMECGACARNCPVNALSVKNGVGCAAGLLSSALGVKSNCCGESQPCCCGDSKTESKQENIKTEKKEHATMNEQNESPKQESGTCGPGCACNATGSSKKTRWLVGAIVLVIAGVLVARAVVKNNSVSSTPASTGFVALAAPAQMPETTPAVTPPVTDAVKEIASLMELNSVAADSAGVFVYLPGTNETTTKTAMTQIRGAARTIEPKLNGGKIGVFTLKAGTQDYKQVASQTTVPGVLAMVKGGGMSATSGDITETKLVQAFVAASKSGGCGPSSGGCGPSSTGCK